MVSEDSTIVEGTYVEDHPNRMEGQMGYAYPNIIRRESPEVGTDFNGLINETFPQIADSKSKFLDFPEAPELDALIMLDHIERPGIFNLSDIGEMAETISDEAVAASQAGVRVRDTSIIMYTSGTTAMPKGAMLSHESFSRYAASIKERLWLPEFKSEVMVFPTFLPSTSKTLISTLEDLFRVRYKLTH